MRRMDIDPTRQSEVSQREKSKYHMLTYTHTHTETRKIALMNLFAGQN